MKSPSRVPLRPISPFWIYKPQITSVLSILHRATGIFLYGGVILWIWSVVIVIYSNKNYVSEFYHTFFILPAIWIWCWCLFYHLLNGIRHLIWDIGKGFDIKTATLSGWFVVIGSFILTAIMGFCSY